MREGREVRGGRRPDRNKNADILTAARDSFLKLGVAATTVQDVAARAQVSKVTIYKRWSGKEALFEAVVRAEMASMLVQLNRWPEVDGPLQQRLNILGGALLRFLFSPSHVALDRMLACNLAQSPELVRGFFKAGPNRCRAQIATTLASANERGEIDIDDPLLSATDLLSLWQGFLPKELEFGIVTYVDEFTIRFRVERGTRNFLRMVSRAPL